MILIVLTILLVGLFFYDTSRFPLYVLSYYVFYDMFDGFYQDNKIYAVLRYVIPLMLLFAYVFRYNVFKKLPGIFMILVSYLVILWILNSGDLIVTSRTMLAVIITLLMIPIGQHYGKNHRLDNLENEDLITKFEKYNRVLLIALPLYIVYANVTHIAAFYTDAFSTGYLITSRIYIMPIVVFLAVHYTLSNENRSWVLRGADALFILINVCMILINTRRTALAMLALALVVYSMYNKKVIAKMVSLLVIVIVGLIVSYPLYADRLNAQLEKRERIEHLDSYEDEGRYLETLYILDYHKRHQNIIEIMYGIELFDTYDFGLKYFRRDRPIHSDINMLFFSTGLIGMLIFSLFFIHYFFNGNKNVIVSNRKIYYPFLVMFLLVLIPGRFIGTLTYAPLLMFMLTALKSEPELVTEEVELREYREDDINSGHAMIAEEASGSYH